MENIKDKHPDENPNSARWVASDIAKSEKEKMRDAGYTEEEIDLMFGEVGRKATNIMKSEASARFDEQIKAHDEIENHLEQQPDKDDDVSGGTSEENDSELVDDNYDDDSFYNLFDSFDGSDEKEGGRNLENITTREQMMERVSGRPTAKSILYVLANESIKAHRRIAETRGIPEKEWNNLENDDNYRGVFYSYDLFRYEGLSDRDRESKIDGYKNFAWDFLKDRMNRKLSVVRFAKEHNFWEEQTDQVKEFYKVLEQDFESVEKANEALYGIGEKYHLIGGQGHDGAEFTHFYSLVDKDGRAFKNKFGETEARLYLCPDIQNVIPIAKAFFDKCDEENLASYLKISSGGDRNDRMIVYSSYKNIGKYLAILEKIKEESPEFFENMGKGSLWGRIDGAPEGVYFGEQPDESVSRESYNGLRAGIIDEAFEQWAKGRAIHRRVEDPHYPHEWYDAYKLKEMLENDEFSDDDYEEFDKILDQQLEKHHISPDSFCFGGIGDRIWRSE